MRAVVKGGLLGLAGLLMVASHEAVRAGAPGVSIGAAAGAAAGTRQQRNWEIRQFTRLLLDPRESGSAPNEQPVQVDPEVLRSQLAQVRFTSAQGEQPLFVADELADLAAPLAEALATARPDDDILLLSSSRRGGGIFAQPDAVTARLFVQGGALQLIVHDTRFEFMNLYLGSRTPPVFTYGSRNRTSSAQLRSAVATNRRADWLSLPFQAVVPAAVVLPTAAPAPTAQPAAVAAPAAAAPAARPAPPPAAVPPLRPRDPGYAEEVEQRLLTLKRLRERNLITEEEYQQKRREILQQL